MREPITGFTDASGASVEPSRSASGASVLAASAAWRTCAAAAAILAVSAIAGVVRVVPLFLGDHVSVRLLPVLLRGIAGVSLETALFVAPPIGWAMAAARLVDRGEARALAALGVRPARIVADAWPAALVVALSAAIAAGAWGNDAAAPGRALRGLVAEARAACASAKPPAVAVVPVLDAAWVCSEGEAPRLVGQANGSNEGAFTATAAMLSDDLRSIDAVGFELFVPASEARPALHARAATASLRGLAPVGRASNLGPATRALLLGLSATVLATVAAALALVLAVRRTAGALALGALGPAAALLVLSSLERAPSTPLFHYVGVPAAGLSGLALAWGWLRVRARR